MAKYLGMGGPREPLVREIALPRDGGEPELVLIRRFSPADILASGVIPQPFVRAVMALAEAGSLKDDKALEKTVSDQDMASMATMINRVVCCVVIIPPPDLIAGKIGIEDIRAAQCIPMFVEGDPDPAIVGQAGIEDLEFADRIEIFSEAMKPDAAFRRSTEQPGGVVDAVPATQTDGVAPVRTRARARQAASG